MGAKGDVKYQYLAGLCVNIISVSYGAFCGWPSSAILELKSASSPLSSGPISSAESGWIASFVCIGALFGTLVFAWLSNEWGRKPCLMAIAIPSILGWWIIPFADSMQVLCLARFLGGTAGGGIFAVIPIYVTELASNKMRGILGTFLVLSCNFGIVIAFILGYYFNYKTVAWICSSITILFVICFVFMPETPQHLARLHKLEKAEKSLFYYRNVRSYESKELSEELQLELSKLRESEISTSERTPKVPNSNHVTWKDFVERKVRKVFLIGLLLTMANQLCGCFSMLNFTAVIFKQSGSSMSAKSAAIVVGVIQLIGSYMSTLLVERVGRKLLLIVSAVGIVFGQSVMGIYGLLDSQGYEMKSFGWMPIFGFSFMLFIACFGLLTLPFLVISEIMPAKIRSKANMILMTILWALTGIMIMLLPILMDALKMHGTVFLFASFSAVIAILIAIFVPETKGKTNDEILESL